MNASDFIQIIGIIVTGIFSFLVWKATQKQAEATIETAKLTSATLELSKRLAEKAEIQNKEFKEKIRRQLKVKILTVFDSVFNALNALSREQIHRQVTSAIKDLDVDDKEIASNFTKDEFDAITDAWNSYKEYLRKYFRMGYPSNDGASLDDLYNRTDVVIPKLRKAINILRRSE